MLGLCPPLPKHYQEIGKADYPFIRGSAPLGLPANSPQHAGVAFGSPKKVGAYAPVNLDEDKGDEVCNTGSMT